MDSNIVIDDDFTLEVEEEDDDDEIHEENLNIKTEPDWEIEDVEFEPDVTNIKQEIDFEEHLLAADKYVDLLEIKTEIEREFDALRHFEDIPSITETSLPENMKDFASDQENSSLTKNYEILTAVEPSTSERSNLLPEDIENSSLIESCPAKHHEIPVAVEPSTNERSIFAPKYTEEYLPAKDEEIPVAVEPSTNERSIFAPKYNEELFLAKDEEIPLAVETSTNERSIFSPDDTDKFFPAKNQEIPMAVKPSTNERSIFSPKDTDEFFLAKDQEMPTKERNNFLSQDTEKKLNGNDKAMQTVNVSITEKQSITNEQRGINRVYSEADSLSQKRHNQKSIAQSSVPLDRRKKKILSNLTKNSHELKKVPSHSFNKKKERKRLRKSKNRYSHILKYNRRNQKQIRLSKKFVKKNFYVPFSLPRSNDQRWASSNVERYKSFNQFQTPLMTWQPFSNNSVPNQNSRLLENYRNVPSVKHSWSRWGDKLKNRPQVWQNQAPSNYSATSQVEAFISTLQVFNQLNNIIVAQKQQDHISCMTNIKFEMSFLNKFRSF